MAAAGEVPSSFVLSRRAPDWGIIVHHVAAAENPLELSMLAGRPSARHRRRRTRRHGASRRSLASVEAMGAGGAWAKGPPAAGRWAGRGGRVPVEDGARVQWVFIGCPGVGKCTYAVRLSRLLGMPHIASDDLVRDELASQGPLSKQFQNNNVEAALEDTMAIALRRSIEFDEGKAWSREGWIVLFLEFSLCVEPPNGAAVFGNCHVTERGGERRIIMVGPQMLGSALMLNQRLKTRLQYKHSCSTNLSSVLAVD